jgi:hypothetical protein
MREIRRQLDLWVGCPLPCEEHGQGAQLPLYRVENHAQGF